MPVAQVADGTRLEPNRVYVIPPNKDLTVDRGVLRLAKLGSGHMPIDNFFSSLAKDRQEKAIGVILSGTASDGTRGLKAIKDFGGITFAQDQKSAKYTGMPMSAVASGYVDFVLPPQEIAHSINGWHSIPVWPLLKQMSGVPKESEALQTMFRLLRTSHGRGFQSVQAADHQAKNTAANAPAGDSGPGSVCPISFETHPSEIRDLFEDILIPVTSFFREPETFQALKKRRFSEDCRQRQENEIHSNMGGGLLDR